MFNITTVNCQESSKEKEQLISTYTEQLLMMEAGLRAIQDFDLVEEIGTILTVKDGIVEADGLIDVSLGELVRFESHELGVVMNLETDLVKIILLGEGLCLKPGDSVYREGRLAGLVVSPYFFGRIIDSLGNFVDDEEMITEEDIDENIIVSEGWRELLVKAPGIIAREKIVEPMYTGILMIDSMIPIGRGQRELIIGDRQTGKTSVALDTIVTQARLKSAEGYNYFSGLFCIYVSVGQRRSSVSLISKKLESLGASFFTAIVAATSSDPASLQFLAPYAGCSIGEFFRDSGEHALVIYDDLSKQAVAYRQVSLLLRRPPSREAYPGDIFYLHSRLLERAAKMRQELGGGSLTALPIIETQAGDVSAYIPTNVISITDGQIFLDSSLFHKGLRPAINIGISVSRIGAAAQVKCLRKVAATLKMDLAQYREIEIFASFSSDLDDVTRQLLHRGERLYEILKQSQFKSLTVYEQIVLIYAGVHNYLEKLKLDEVPEFKDFLIKKINLTENLITYNLNGDLPESQIQEFLSRVLNEFDLAKGRIFKAN